MISCNHPRQKKSDKSQRKFPRRRADGSGLRLRCHQRLMLAGFSVRGAVIAGRPEYARRLIQRLVGPAVSMAASGRSLPLVNGVGAPEAAAVVAILDITPGPDREGSPRARRSARSSG